MTTALPSSGKPNPEAKQLYREALKLYKDKPELDPTKDLESLDEFAQCTSADDITLALKKRVDELKGFRDDHWTTLCEKLKPVVEVLLRLTTIVGDAAQSIVCGYILLPSACVIKFAPHRASLAEKVCLWPWDFCWL